MDCGSSTIARQLLRIVGKSCLGKAVQIRRGRAAVTSCGLSNPLQTPNCHWFHLELGRRALEMLEAGKPVKTIGLCPRERRVRTRLRNFGARHCMYIRYCIRACMIYLMTRCVCLFYASPLCEVVAHDCAVLRMQQLYLFS